ncbi:MAG TPA: hypothetical protein VLV31_01210 [Candidatus Acidoferrales bacterium]|nr:hypothetical protein [Candidatus Acidoferrales bacterium]
MSPGPKAGAVVDSNPRSSIDPHLVHITAYCFALHFFFGLVEVLNVSQLSYFYYFPAIVHIVIAGPITDMILWTCSLIIASTTLLVKGKVESRVLMVRLVVVATGAFAGAELLATVFMHPIALLTFALFAIGTLEFLLLTRGRKLSLMNHTLGITTAIYLLVLFCIIEVSSATFYVLRPFGAGGVAASGQLNALIELQLTYAAYGLLPLLYLGFLTSFFWAPLLDNLWKRISPLPFQPEIESIQLARPLSSTVLDPKFLLAVVVAFFIGYYPYFQNQNSLVGTDSYWVYYEPLLQMNAGGPSAAVHQALGASHPVTLLLLYLAQFTQMSPFNVVKLSPVLLTLMLAVAFCFFIGGRRSNSLGLMAFVFSVLSATTAIGLYASTIANWIVLVIWVVFLAYVAFRSDESYRKRDFLILLFLSTLIILIHPWTWGVFAIAVLAASILTLVLKKQKQSAISASLIRIILIDCAFVFLTIILLTWSEGSAVSNALTLYTSVLSNPPSVLDFWSALNWTIKFWSPFLSPAYILLAIIGVLALMRSDVSPWQRRLILSWIFASMIGSILAAPIGFVPNSPASSNSQLWRILFVTPFQATVPFGVMWMSERVHPRKQSALLSELPKTYAWSPLAWIITVLSAGVVTAFAPYVLALAALLILVPIITAVSIEKIPERERAFLSYAIQAVCILIAFNYTTRAASNLLLDSHNYPSGNAQLSSGSVNVQRNPKHGALPPPK